MTWLFSLIANFLARVFSDFRRDAALERKGNVEQAIHSLQEAEHDEAVANRAADTISGELRKPDRFTLPE